MELPDPDSMWGHTTKGLHDTKSVAAGTEVTRLIVRFQVTWSKHVAPAFPLNSTPKPAQNVRRGKHVCKRGGGGVRVKAAQRAQERTVPTAMLVSTA